MAALIVRIIGILTAGIGTLTLLSFLARPHGVEVILLALLILLIGAALIVVSVLAPRWREKTVDIENCLGYPLRVDAEGEPVITCPRDAVEVKLFNGEVTFDEYVESVAPFEFGVKGDSRRAQLAREHAETTLLSSEYADELAALAEEISALRDRYAAGEISDEEYEAERRRLY